MTRHEIQTLRAAKMNQESVQARTGASVRSVRRIEREAYSSVVALQGRPEAWVLTALLVGAAGQGMVEYTITFPLFFSNSLFWLILGMVTNESL